MDAERHCEQIDGLLPWHVNRSLRGHDAEIVQSHLEHCERCRDEAEWLASVGAHLRDAELKPSREAPLADLRARISDGQQRRPVHFAMAAGLLMALAVTLGVVLAWQPLAPRYHTVTDPVPVAANTVMLELELTPDAPLSSLYSILEAHNAAVVAGPDARGHVQLEFRLASDETAESLVRTLRRNPEIADVSHIPGKSLTE